MKDRVIHCFNKSTKTYDSAANVQTIIAERLAKRVASLSVKQILEIGCGTGLFSQMLIDQFPMASLILTDIAPNMVMHCQARFSSYSAVQVNCVDGENAHIPASTDLIVSSMTLHWFVEMQKSFEKIILQMKSGSRFVFAMLGENSLMEWKMLCRQYHFPIATPQFVSMDNLAKLFTDFKIEKEMITITHQNCFDFLKTLKRIGATASQKTTPLSTRQLRCLMNEPQAFDVSYEVIYGYYQKA